MSGDGTKLEALVRSIEKLLIPSGFEVTANNRVYDENGVPVAEFDIQIRGKLGSAEIRWLIECRDRPQDGPAPASWIEQLVGRRSRFLFNRVTAVSSTGFSAGAMAYASQMDIDLRQVTDLSAEDVRKWMVPEGRFTLRQTIYELKDVLPLVEEQDREAQLIVEKALRGLQTLDKLLSRADSQVLYSFAEVFRAEASAHPELLEGIEPNSEGRKVQLRVIYPTDKRYALCISQGDFRLSEIVFVGDISIQDTAIAPILSEYAHDPSKEIIAQTASYGFLLDNQPVAIELHNLASTGETHVLLRRVKKTK